MNTTERKLTIEELIEALELHLSPRTDPDHCNPCPYDEEQREEPQTTCQYRLMRDCLEALKQYRRQVNECYFVKDFIEYTLASDIQKAYSDVCAPFAFMLGAAFERYKNMWEN